MRNLHTVIVEHLKKSENIDSKSLQELFKNYGGVQDETEWQEIFQQNVASLKHKRDVILKRIFNKINVKLAENYKLSKIGHISVLFENEKYHQYRPNVDDLNDLIRLQRDLIEARKKSVGVNATTANRLREERYLWARDVIDEAIRIRHDYACEGERNNLSILNGLLEKLK
jgi:hypothetical protein